MQGCAEGEAGMVDGRADHGGGDLRWIRIEDQLANRGTGSGNRGHDRIQGS